MALVSGCGFRPLYQKGSGSDAAVLASVDVAVIKDRIGQQLRNLLLAAFSPRGTSLHSAYKLTVILKESKVGLAIETDETATRANLTLSATFHLTSQRQPDLGTFTGNAFSTNSYDILTSDFATLSAENDARNRGLRSLSEEIRIRVAAAIRNPKAFTPPRPTQKPT
jgi:LPS-assembly lipoprotein